ncbi:MAG TPA: DsrE family protein [Burkholderiales bacterium]|jgi:intracellular sulfur oxidation DsrE/DsrF family protein|nr:DsrE family protein [Burkholderiales bacterium]
MKTLKALSSTIVAGAMLLAGCGTMGIGADPKATVAEDKVVYHVNSGGQQPVDALRNIGNHLEVNPKAKIVVVTHSLGVDFLFKEARDRNGNPFHVAVEGLKERGVKFEVCDITLRNRKLKRDQFIPEATYVPSGVAEITRLQQREGYAYLRP